MLINEWSRSCLTRLSQHSCEKDLFNEAVMLTQELGFDYLAFGIQLQAPVTLKTLVTHAISFLDPEIADPNKTIVLLDNNPPGAMEIFKANYAKTDPLIRHARTSTEILVWTDEVFLDQCDRWALMQEIGIRNGLSQPSRSHTGSIAVANYSRKEGRITASELAEKIVRITTLTRTLHAEIEILLMNKLIPKLPTFSELDRAILRWTALGKTASEIAQILELKERAITTRKSCITQKLSAKTFAQAMLIAYSLGLMQY